MGRSVGHEDGGIPPFDIAMQGCFVASGERDFEQAVGSLAEMQSIVQAQLDEEQRKVQREILQECERRGADLADELVKHYSKEGDGGAVDAILAAAASVRIVSKAAASYCQGVVRQQIQLSADAVKRLSSLRSLHQTAPPPLRHPMACWCRS